MSATHDEPAFPIAGGVHENQFNGMSLRDYFAAKALAIVPPQAAHNMLPNETGPAYMARRAYEYADALLKARAK